MCDNEKIETIAEERERAHWAAEDAAQDEINEARADEPTVDLTEALGSVVVVLVFERWDLPTAADYPLVDYSLAGQAATVCDCDFCR